MNTWLKRWCQGESFRFLGHWDRFWGRWNLYKLDGTGTDIPGGLFARADREGLN